MAILRILSRSGDDCITWDRTRVERADPRALAAVGRAPTLITQFDPTADQTVLVPCVIGG
jgi:hypothetical protein